MKQTGESKTKARIAVVLVVVAVIFVVWQLVPAIKGSAPSATAGPAATLIVKGKTSEMAESLDPRLHLDLLANAENVKYEGKGKNIFRVTTEPVIVPPPVMSPLLRKQQEEAAKQVAVYTPPPPPPITLKYFGITNIKGEKPKAFLSQDGDVWIAREGDVVNRHYKIVRISPNAIEVEDLLNNNRQTIQLTQG